MAPRTMQKERTREAIAAAARALVDEGGDVTMPAVARRARVSEATAYRYYPDLVTLLRDAVADSWPSAALLLGEALDGEDDVAVRVERAARVFCERTLNAEHAVRAIAAESVRRGTTSRPAHRFEIVEYALSTLEPGPHRDELARRLSVVVSAESLFGLLDLNGLDRDAATATLTACAVAVVRGSEPG